MHHPHAAAYPPPPHPSSIVYTEDASTKLSDRVRRRCFNCCTTDTSTWRRSNLSPGKVLCNKCGLFERTHSRPRPEQFPHKRGPLSGGALSQQRGPDPGAYMMRGTPTHTPPSMTHPLPPPPPPSMYPGTTLPPFSNVEKRPYTPHAYASREPSPPDWNAGERQHWTPPPSLVKDEPSKEADQPEKTAVSV
ncbi:hypothetical protein CPB85DRAFT_1232818 [Mucidula mucida]|nr:hypothetical protein CPB85DRAFT_1232818 [Mucidula mucida]